LISELKYRPGKDGLHSVLPETALLWLATVLFAVLATGSLILSAIALAMVACLMFWSERSVRTWTRSLRFVMLFAVLLFAAQALSVREGNVLFRFGVPITDQGLLSGAAMSLRFLSILSSSFLFAVTTDPDALAHALIRWGLPYRFGYTIILALRFVPFFRHELQVVRDAQQVRGIRVSVRSLRGIRRALRYTFLPVLVSGLMRVDAIAMSMKGRAFGLHNSRTADHRSTAQVHDLLVWLCSTALIGLTIYAWRSSWS
jgi:energy-coupling factor transport system permease protein